MILVNLKGGLGNQLLQYSYAKYLSEITGQPFVLDLSWYFNPGSNTPREFLLDKLFVGIKVSNRPVLGKVLTLLGYIPNKFVSTIDDSSFSNITKRSRNYILNGYFLDKFHVMCNAKSFSDAFSDYIESNLPRSMIENARDRVGIHVRRGDYVSNNVTKSFHGVCELQYYESAIDKLEKCGNKKYFVISDDIEWCRKNFSNINADFYYSDDNTVIGELGLFLECKGHIISNSTYSWWGAILRDAPVVYPILWFRTKASPNIFIEKWIAL